LSFHLNSVRFEDVVVSRTSLRGFVTLCLFCTALTGCTSAKKELPEEETRIKNLAIIRGQYMSRNQGKVPPNVEALKTFAKSLNPDQLKGFGVTSDVEPMFVSPRDNEPFVYRVVKESAPGVGTKTVVFHEKTGKNGKRMVAYPTGEVQEVDEAKFKELVPESAPK
jgi:hypothetical protein